MIANHLSVNWPGFALAVGNHVWQSTLFVVLAGLLALLLRPNHARIRYGLWCAASLKFLAPFALLVLAGSHLSRPTSRAESSAGLYVAMQEVGQPFDQAPASMMARMNQAAANGSLFPVAKLLGTAWFCGFLGVLFVWFLRWRRISAKVREAAPLTAGREVEALRHLEKVVGMPGGVELRLTPSSVEPGIFGIFRPILIWPQGISGRLDDTHLEAILAHELLHVRRSDNLAAAAHMLVQAIFWFYPLVWWIGRRLLEERERACDEAVLEICHDRKAYAESILRICEFCVASPLSCVSGVTGADLKKRIQHIMTEGAARNLDFSRRLLLSAAALTAFAAPLALGLYQAPQRGFLDEKTTGIGTGAGQSAEDQSASVTGRTDWQARAGGKQAFLSASIEENKTGSESSSMNVPIGPGDIYPPNGGRFTAKNVPLISFIYFAYNLTGSQLQLLMPRLPQWVLRDRFDVEARASGNPTKDQMRLMMQPLLEERFKLAVHYETQRLPVFALVLNEPGKTGPQLQRHPKDSSCATAVSASSGSTAESAATVAGGLPVACGGIIGMPSSPDGRMRVGARNVPVELLADSLAQMGNLNRAVLDQTGLRGTFDFTFEWTPQRNHALPTGVNAPLEEPGARFRSELQEQLGLKLESKTEGIEIFVIDHAEKFSGN